MSRDEILSSVYPQFFPAHWLTDTCDIIHAEFPLRIRIGYVMRSDGHYSYLMGEEFEASGLSHSAIRDAALENLRELPMPDLTVGGTPGGPEAFLGETDDNFLAARILLPEVQCGLVSELGPEFYVALPCRDWLVCWSKEQASEFQTRNAADAKKIFLEDEYNLTPDILLFDGSRFSLHQQTVEA